ncbi:unnamed protein product [Albugo candida]|uniref:Uncharacterized protein n=1 Tax=Albugo candida TaxID=65357 RepID=A0A024G4M1_9STRA|nr:unnamed protein product [Albugo candida]|eukprot:CCI41482.1 unnamed protein product [Albugo candida]
MFVGQKGTAQKSPMIQTNNDLNPNKGQKRIPPQPKKKHFRQLTFFGGGGGAGGGGGGFVVSLVDTIFKGIGSLPRKNPRGSLDQSPGNFPGGGMLNQGMPSQMPGMGGQMPGLGGQMPGLNSQSMMPLPGTLRK